MSLIKYTTNHEWLEIEGSTGVVGITERWLASQGEVLDIDMEQFEIGDEYEKDEIVTTISTIDGTEHPLHMPVTGEIIGINKSLMNDPDLLNRSPEGDGWIFKVRIEMRRELKSLMSIDEYEEFDDEEFDEFDISDLDEDDVF